MRTLGSLVAILDRIQQALDAAQLEFVAWWLAGGE
jgi:hypothetical protein